MIKTMTLTVLLIGVAFSSLAQVVSGSPEDHLFAAVRADDLSKVQASLNQGANLLIKDADGKLAVELAVDKGYFTIAHYLLQRSNQLTVTHKTAGPAAVLKPAQDIPFAAPIDVITEVLVPEFFMTEDDPFSPSAPVKTNLAPPVAGAYEQKKPKPQVQIVNDPKPAPTPKPKVESTSAPLSVGPFINAGTQYDAPISVALPKKAVISHKIPHKNLNGAIALALGKAPPHQIEKNPATCMTKGQKTTTCIEKTSWSEGLFNHFDELNSSIYKRFGRGGRAVVGYREGVSSFIKTIFAGADYDAVVEHFTHKFGDPDQREEHIIAPLGKPRKVNLVLSWYGHDDVQGRETVLQVFHYDVMKNRFPIMRQGAVIYKYFNEPSVFTYVNPIELIRLP